MGLNEKRLKAMQSLMYKQRQIICNRPVLCQFHYDSERECLTFTNTHILVEIFEPDVKESIVYRKYSEDLSSLAFPKTGHLYSKSKAGRVDLTYNLKTLRRLEKEADDELVMFNHNPKGSINEFTGVSKKYIKDLAIFLGHFGYKDVVLSVHTKRLRIVEFYTKDGEIKGLIAPVKYI